MKVTGILLIGVMVALVAVTVPRVWRAAYAEDIGYIERLVPAESMEVETGGSETPFVAVEPLVRGNDSGYIERLLPADSQEAEAGGGETPFVTVEPLVRGNDPGYIERLLPADSMKLETGGGFDLKDWE